MKKSLSAFDMAEIAYKAANAYSESGSNWQNLTIAEKERLVSAVNFVIANKGEPLSLYYGDGVLLSSDAEAKNRIFKQVVESLLEL